MGFETNCCWYTILSVVAEVGEASVDSILEEYGVDNPGSCIGAFSGQPVVSENSSPTNFVSYTLLVVSLSTVLANN